jgi:hypothetical protein
MGRELATIIDEVIEEASTRFNEKRVTDIIVEIQTTVKM